MPGNWYPYPFSHVFVGGVRNLSTTGGGALDLFSPNSLRVGWLTLSLFTSGFMEKLENSKDLQETIRASDIINKLLDSTHSLVSTINKLDNLIKQ